MANKIFTRGIAIVYLLMGICAFIPPLNGGPRPNTPSELKVHLHFENLFWQLSMNYLLAGILIGFGITGLIASTSLRSCRVYQRILFLTALAFMFIGLCPAPIGTVWGFLPLTIWTDGFFLMTALCTFYFAFFEGPMLKGATEPVFKQ